jgi:hypothetical protein
MGTFTFVSKRHDKNYAWYEFIKQYATPSQQPIAIMPGHAIVYTNADISKDDAVNEAV